jgi:hypothetical protein
MSYFIDKLKQQLNEMESRHNNEQQDLRGQIQTALNALFDDDSELQKAIADVQLTNKYCTNEHGEICQWLGFRTAKYIGDLPYLAAYLQEHHFIDLDADNDSILYPLGPQIIVNDEGDVYDEDSGKWIITEKDYAISMDDDPTGEMEKAKRNQLIELWMEKNGYFPGVYFVDRYGNVSPINTQAK